MSVHKVTLPSGRVTWQARWRDPSGRARAKNFRTKDEAVRHERNVRADVDRGVYRPPDSGRVTLGQWCETWLAAQHHLKPKSLLLYRQALAHILPVLGDKRLDRVTPEDIDAYVQARLAEGAAASSVHREYRTLRTAFRFRGAPRQAATFAGRAGYGTTGPGSDDAVPHLRRAGTARRRH